MTAAHLNDAETFFTAIMLAAGIFLTRVLPFLLFSKKAVLPGTILYLGGALPHACMTMLLVYCLKDVSLAAPPYGAPEGLGLAFTIGMQVWRKNVMLSIAGGTLFYMFLVQKVFVAA